MDNNSRIDGDRNPPTPSDAPDIPTTREQAHIAAASGRVADDRIAGKTVWSDIKSAQPNYPGTDLPKAFEMQAGERSFWVHENATEHIYENAKKRSEYLAQRDKVGLITQAEIHNLQSAVKAATRDEVPLDRMVRENGWELKFGQRPSDRLPVLFHAVYKGGAP
ncbi:hypothetical protein [Planomonospora algeriensis]